MSRVPGQQGQLRPHMDALIKETQKVVDELAKFPAYVQYVEQHNLKLIDSRLADIDKLLDEGLLKVPKR